MERSQFDVSVDKGYELVPALAEKPVFIEMLGCKKFTGFWFLLDNKENNDQSLFSTYSFFNTYHKNNGLLFK